MKRRIIFLASLYVATMLIFALQKPLFMLFNCEFATSLEASDWCHVIINGMKLDAVVTGYIICLPLLLTIVSVWKDKLALRRILCPYYAVIAAALSAAFVADAALYGFWQFKLDATIFAYIDSPQGATASISIWFVIAGIAAFLLFAFLYYFILSKLTPKNFALKLRYVAPMPVKEDVRRHTLLTAFFVVLAIPLAISIRGGIEESTANVGVAYFSPNEFLNHSAVNPAFSFLYSLGKTENYDEQFNYYDDRELTQITHDLYAPTDSVTEHLLTTERPNVLLIVMEGVGQMFMQSGGANPNIAPNLNRLSKEGVFFDNCYSNSFRTDRGLVSTISGYPAFPTLSVMKIAAKTRHLPSIGRSLKTQGYATHLLYGGDINFTGMQGYFRTAGYDNIVSDKDFKGKDKQNAWGVNDDVTFRWLYNHLLSLPTDKPWHQTFLTLSSHEPFDVPYDRLKDKKANAFAFTDHCLGEFVRRIRKTPLWENLLIVCIPDHGFAYPSTISHEKHQHNQMLWLGGAVKAPRRISTLMNQSDFAATLLAQLGIDHSDFTLSRNVLSPNYRYPFIFSCSRGTIVFRDSTGYIDYDINAEKMNEKQGTNSAKQLRTLKAILQSNYDNLEKL